MSTHAITAAMLLTKNLALSFTFGSGICLFLRHRITLFPWAVSASWHFSTCLSRHLRHTGRMVCLYLGGASYLQFFFSFRVYPSVVYLLRAGSLFLTSLNFSFSIDGCTWLL
jgi:hypothetical protein